MKINIVNRAGPDQIGLHDTEYLRDRIGLHRLDRAGPSSQFIGLVETTADYNIVINTGQD